MTQAVPAPLPRWRDFTAALAGERPDPAVVTRPWRRPGEEAFVFSRSAWALVALVRWWKTLVGIDGTRVTVWIPDYFCNEALGPVRRQEVDLRFYPVDMDLCPDWAKTAATVPKYAVPGLFLLVHYFGVPGPAEDAAEFCSKHNLLLVEDAAHVLRPIPGIGEHGAAAFYSPHKLLPIPDGSVLTFRTAAVYENWGRRIVAEPAPVMHRVMSDMGERCPSASMWFVRRRGGVLARRVRRSSVDAETFFENPAVRPSGCTPAMSAVSMRLLERISSRLDEIALDRRQLDQECRLLAAAHGPCQPVWPTLPATVSPYVCAVRCADGAAASTLFARLHASRTPASSWPDLPPEVDGKPDHHRGAIRLRNSVVTIPLNRC